jgi:G3E family GTPase
VIGLFNPADVARGLVDAMPYYQQLVEGSDILVANRSDLVGEEQLKHFRKWAGELYPPKLQVIVTSYGRLPDEAFTPGRQAVSAPAASLLKESAPAHGPMHEGVAGHGHEGHAHDPGIRTAGALWDAGVEFSRDGLVSRLQRLASEGLGGSPVRRFKGIFRTDRGWYLYQIAFGQVTRQVTSHRLDSRADWIVEGGEADAGAVKSLLVEAAKGLY